MQDHPAHLTNAASASATLVDGTGWLDSLLPETPGSYDILTVAGIVGGAVLAALAIYFVLLWVFTRFVGRTESSLDNAALKSLRKPAALLLLAGALQFVIPTIAPSLYPPVVGVVRHALAIVIIIAAAWFIVGLIDLGLKIILARHRTDVADNLRARQIHTQLRVVHNIMLGCMIVLAAGGVLMTFPAAEQFGASILASAGIAGIAIGLAARPIIENLLAGLQIAFTQPIRLDDVVVIDGEFGRVEEITTTYVVVKVWDQRRLIVPFSRIIAETFENWTRTGADTLGTVFVRADYTAPINKVREELNRLTEHHSKWDRRVRVLQVTDLDGSTMQLRALLSAANSSDSFDLCCDIREGLIAYLQREHPGSLPRLRISPNDEPDPSDAADTVSPERPETAGSPGP